MQFLKLNWSLFDKQGHKRLLNALATFYGKILDREIDSFNEVLVTIGAHEALFTAILANVDDDDEVIIIEPNFDSYQHIIRLAGGKVRRVQLKLVGMM